MYAVGNGIYPSNDQKCQAATVFSPIITVFFDQPKIVGLKYIKDGRSNSFAVYSK